MIEFSVIQGIIHINSIRVLLATKDIIHVEVDTKQKYPERGGYSSDGSFPIPNREDTIGITDPSAPDTEVKILGIDSWLKGRIDISQSMLRYGCRITIVRVPEEYDMKDGYWDDTMEEGN